MGTVEPSSPVTQLLISVPKARVVAGVLFSHNIVKTTDTASAGKIRGNLLSKMGLLMVMGEECRKTRDAINFVRSIAAWQTLIQAAETFRMERAEELGWRPV